MTWREDLKAQHRKRQAEHQWRSRLSLRGPQGPKVCVGNQTLHNFCSNDYLGLANDRRLIEAARQACENGTGSGASHLICGHSEAHERLEAKLAHCVGAESALVFSTGYMANLAIPQSFLGAGDLVLEDKLNHASLIDAGRWSGARFKRFPHRDVEAAERILAKFAGGGRVVVSTDSVFSMDGDLAPLAELDQLCRQVDGLFVIDEAHGFGVLGERGLGAMELAGLKPHGHRLMVGTLGKAAGSFGAFVAGDAVLIEHLVQYARTYIYTTALPPAVVAATDAAVDIIQREPERRQKLRTNVNGFRERLNEHPRGGVVLQRMMDSPSPIQPLVIGDEATALWASEYLRQNGILALAIRPPTVPVGSARLRFTLTAAHDAASIEALVRCLTSAEMLQRLSQPLMKPLSTGSERVG